MTSGIYEIVNAVNGHSYVGSAKDFANRWSGHQSRLRKGKHHNRHLQSAWDKYGADAFTFRRLLLCSAADLLLYEQIVIDGKRPEYNIAPRAGNTLGRRLSDETKAKIAVKAIGRKRSRESVERAAEKRRGVPLSPEHRATLLGNTHAQGLKHTDEWKAATSARQLGQKRPKDAQWRERIAASLRGRKATPEARANQAAAQLGKKRGPYKSKSKVTQ